MSSIQNLIDRVDALNVKTTEMLAMYADALAGINGNVGVTEIYWKEAKAAAAEATAAKVEVLEVRDLVSQIRDEVVGASDHLIAKMVDQSAAILKTQTIFMQQQS